MEGLTKLFPFEAPKQTFCSLMGIAAPGCYRCPWCRRGPALRMVAVVILSPMICTQIVVHQPGSSWTLKQPQTTGWTRRESDCKTDLRPVLTICYCIIPHATHTHKALHTMHVECYHQVNSRLKRKLCLLLLPCYHFWCHHQTPCEP
jgi:hypothetical protein